MNSPDLNTSSDQAPLVVHIIYRLGIGGLENGLVNLINHMPKDAYRHAIVCLKDSTDFQQRLTRSDVMVYQIHKKEGQDWGSLVRVYRLLKQLKPAIVHTRNLAAIEYQFSAWLAGVKARVHGEHGWDVFDPDGNNVKYQWVRRLLDPLIHRFIPLSRQLERYLIDKIYVSPKKITRICNGVDTKVFFPLKGYRTALTDCPFAFGSQDLIIGTVGRMHGVKDQLTLVRAFILACQRVPNIKQNVRLMIIGEGPLRQQALVLLTEHQLIENAWLPGERNDVAEIMRRIDLFVLPSQAEGISNTILEAMATALPVLATDVGGNSELVEDGKTGRLTAAGDAETMAEIILDYMAHIEKMRLHAQHAYRRALTEFSLGVMVARYQSVYDSLLKQE
ncbi:MAG: TIGR03088 family PEP-CTERM/XrtA system glycosyltransferase [Methylococcaceae bacterium]|nr:TIGR03088 family PEP-CTERM/XrtA system glycosyltransferase [Methylococcaceae bacterium]